MRALNTDVFLSSLILFIFVFIPSEASCATFVSAGVRLNKPVIPLSVIKRQNVVTQSLDFSCGAAGLSTLINFYLDDPVSEIEIINTLLNSVPLAKIKERRGFSLYDLKSYALSKGYDVSGYKMDMEFLRKLNKHVLVPSKFRNNRHFVVVKGVIADRVFIADPTAGNVSMKVSQFRHIWVDGIGLVIENAKSRIQTQESALKVHEKDFVMVDYKMMRRLINPAMIRTAIYPGEF
jgi:uncharacterized protein